MSFISIVIVTTFLISNTHCAKILQITDVHLDLDYNTKGDPDIMCHLRPNVSKDLGKFGDYMCDSPKSLFEHLIKRVKQILPEPDLLLLTGDFIPHINKYDFDYVRGVVKIVTDYVNENYPNTKVLPVLGNHDAVPPNYFPDHNGTIYETFYDLWNFWIGEDNKDTFLKGGYYKYQWKEKAVIVVLNTNLYYLNNPAIEDFKTKSDPAGQFYFLTSTLEEAKATGKTVHIIAHIAPGVFERVPFFPWMRFEYNEFLVNITVKYAHTIGWMIFGHHHTDTFQIVMNEKKQPVQVYLMAPSVTPWFSNLPGAGSVNPSFRIYDMDDSTQQLTDATTYWIDLMKLNQNELTNWEVEYSMRKEYGVESLNATSMNSILEKLKKEDKGTWQKYIKFNSVGWNVTMPQDVSRMGQICSIENPSIMNYVFCMANNFISTEPPVSTTQNPEPPVSTTRNPEPPVSTTRNPEPPVSTTRNPNSVGAVVTVSRILLLFLSSVAIPI